jgi:7,8-didemethyl-8-hydroxy-5-deazariboflavin synthase CofG subunit
VDLPAISAVSTAPQAGISRGEALNLITATGYELQLLFETASHQRLMRTGTIITYSRKVFIPLTNLCRDRCGYCTFARLPDDSRAHTMTPEEVLSVAEAGRRAGCKEALFSLGERPELRYPEYRKSLEQMGYESTIEYTAAMCRLVFQQTGLLPHVNPGTMTEGEIESLAAFNVSMGMMLESTSNRLLRAGEAHHRCPDKTPAARLDTLEAAGRQGVPFTTGLLIGIGETVEERVDTLMAIRDVQERHGNIQEVIVQNFRAKPDTPFAARAEPGTLDLLRTAAVARRLLPGTNIQVPPNLSPSGYGTLLHAGINDWGGISPVTLDHINPEKAWPAIRQLRLVTSAQGFQLRERLAIYPEFVERMHAGLSPAVRAAVLRLRDAAGLVRKEDEVC